MIVMVHCVRLEKSVHLVTAVSVISLWILLHIPAQLPTIMAV